MSDSFYITTAIDYANGPPHLGHAYEKVLTDILARYQRRQGADVFFLTGVDEHGMKVQKSAEQENQTPQEYCDKIASYFQDLCGKLNISNDDFVRTTQERHKKVVRLILQQLYDKGEIYQAEYEGYYSQRQEQFLTEKEMVDGKFPEEYGEVIQLKENNYFFRLSKYQDWLKDFLTENPDFIYPHFKTKEVLGALENPIPDLCISRPKSRLSWGIPLPFDEEHVTYVWFDALINYISIPGYDGKKVEKHWPAVHVIGKDILVPAHAIYWPIMLKAADIELPKQIIVHGFWTQNQEKLSKSTGNVIDPLELIDTYGVDAFRYFVMREMSVGQDADFSLEQFEVRYQSELGNNLGNLVNRTVSMIKRYREGKVPQKPKGELEDNDKDLRESVIASIQAYREHQDKLQIHLALTELWKGITRTNQFVEESAPWKLAKDEAQAERLDSVLYEMVAALQLLLSEVVVVLPSTVEKAFSQLNLKEIGQGKKEIVWPEDLSGVEVGDPSPLFPRIEKG